ncbi:putative alpha-galactosidase B [Sphaerosporella brunnea]|uniref:Alpha-galactosidase n=1 Tax=Sphaerosporella brunnea TaxID=1250544 RepID=A0A5J5EIU9_9PEZI|nr:putative alpha-galactosidase B [Sphaerosporella brunnea]
MFLPSLLALVLASSATGLVTKDGSGRLPAMGWNHWNAYRCNINEDKILSAAKSIQDLGLQDAGYEYINIDDCWSVKSGRDPVTNRILPDLTKFPAGISGTAKTLHGMGFKVGLYSDAGSKTCGGYPGSLYYEDIDAATFSEWGIDYLKYDNCNVPSSWPSDEYNNCHPDYNHPTGPNATCPDDPNVAPPDYDWSTSSTAKRFKRMGDALLKQDRTILYSLCEWGQAGVETWGDSIAQSWRITDDIFPYFARIRHIVNYNQFRLNYVNFWGHNDADMLDLGNGNLTTVEARTHFALWAAMKSPLLIGTDLSVLASELVDVLKNPYLINFNQDPIVGEPAMPFNWDWTYNDAQPAEYWAGKYRNSGEILLLMVNWGEEEKTMRAAFGVVPSTTARGAYEVTDVWTGKDLGLQRRFVEATVEPHGTAAFMLRALEPV